MMGIERTADQALADFTVEAIDEATEILRNGDSSTKLALIKMVLSGAVRSQTDDSEAHLEALKAEARALFAGAVDVGGDSGGTAAVP
jgi:hypothetical protein